MAWWKTAKPGDKVVCVVDGWPQVPEASIKCPLQFGTEYTIFELRHILGMRIDGSSGGHVAIILEGVQNPYRSDNGFDVFRFRPVQKRETDISLFKAILTKTPEQNIKELEGVE